MNNQGSQQPFQQFPPPQGQMQPPPYPPYPPQNFDYPPNQGPYYPPQNQFTQPKGSYQPQFSPQYQPQFSPYSQQYPLSTQQYPQQPPQYPPQQQPPQYPPQQQPPQYPPQQQPPQYPPYSPGIEQPYPPYSPGIEQPPPVVVDPQQQSQPQINKQEEEQKKFQEIAAKLDPSFQQKLQKEKEQNQIIEKLMNINLNEQPFAIQQTPQQYYPLQEPQQQPQQQFQQQQVQQQQFQQQQVQQQYQYPYQPNPPYQQFQPPPPQQQFNYQNLLLPPNEANQQIDLLTGSKIGVKHERDDFAYIGSKEIKGYEKFSQLHDQLQKSKQQFKDPQFPSDLNSLIEKEGSRYKYVWKKYTWKRPTEFYKGEYFLFMKSLKTFQYNNPSNLKASKLTNNLLVSKTGLDGIEPDDIKQGELGDCYFLATLSAIAEFPWRIKQLFITRKANTMGIYCVKMCHFGEWQTVVVDDYFPCNARGPAFTRGNDNEIWVLILEKAWAKLFGSYERIEAGLTREALRSLTGAPTAVFWTDCPEDELWNAIQNGDKSNYIMTCGSQDENDLNSKQADKMGLVSGHAYTLIGCAQHNGAKLVLLRNPWGNKEWKGKWSDSENIWTPELQKKLNHNPDSNDGTFYIELSDFRKYFTDMQICYYIDGYQYTSIKIQSTPRNAVFIKMFVKEESEYYISINQESKRVFAEHIHYQYSVSKLLIARKNNGRYEWVGGKQYQDREFWEKVYLTPGEYLIYVKTYWFDQKSRYFVLSSYGKGQVQFQQENKRQLPPNILELIFKSHKMGKLQSYRELPQIQKNYEAYMNEGFGIFWIKNQSNKKFSTKISLTKMNGLKVRKPYKGNIIQLTAEPNQDAIALINVGYKGYSLGFQESYSF